VVSAPQGGRVKPVLALVAVLAGLAMLANVGLQTLDPIPDGAPLFGNLDELVASAALLWGLWTLFRRPRA
jgi:hypothetical protein